MKLSDFHFDLPEALIAHYPQQSRTNSRLLCMDRQTGALADHHFYELADLLEPGDLLVFNNTRVIPARLFGRKESGGQIEVLIERVMADNQVMAQIRASKSPKPGSVLEFILPDNSICRLAVLGREDNFFQLQFPAEQNVLQVLESIGHMPLPPYIKRDDEVSDKERYQTVYARHKGAVAAPTAGLHFDEALLKKLQEKGVEQTFVTLHVGAGTFQPVRADNIEDHHMHSEYLEVSAEVCQQVEACRARGGRVVAVGTTSVRCLETASANGKIAPYQGDTNIFIYPGYTFKSVDALITNFHLPESTLIMLVSAFSSREHVLRAYQAAVEKQYRFFSYGDAMFIRNT